MDRPVGRGLISNDYSRGRLRITSGLFYIGVAGSSLRETKNNCQPSTLNRIDEYIASL
jgi:hypothetical protein